MMPRASDVVGIMMKEVAMVVLPSLALIVVAGMPGLPVVAPASAGPRGGWIRVEVAAVMPTGEGHAMFLVNEREGVLVPVEIALADAVELFARVRSAQQGRPKNGLVDELVTSLGASVTNVELSLSEAGVEAHVSLQRTDGTALLLQPRPSDAVAMAIGAHMPIWASRELVQQLGRSNVFAEDAEDVDAHRRAVAAADARVGVRGL
jgi:uncharacterized protein